MKWNSETEEAQKCKKTFSCGELPGLSAPKYISIPITELVYLVNIGWVHSQRRERRSRACILGLKRSCFFDREYINGIHSRQNWWCRWALTPLEIFQVVHSTTWEIGAKMKQFWKLDSHPKKILFDQFLFDYSFFYTYLSTTYLMSLKK